LNSSFSDNFLVGMSGLKSFFGLCCKVILMDRLRADSWITMHSNLSIKTNLLWCWLLKIGVKKSRVEIWLHDSVCVFYLFPLSFVVFILFVAQFLAWSFQKIQFL
jgi:hypothetical protein